MKPATDRGQPTSKAVATRARLLSFANLSMAEANQRCLNCHGYGNEHANFLRSSHADNDVGCISCHSPHHDATSRRAAARRLTCSRPQLPPLPVRAGPHARGAKPL